MLLAARDGTVGRVRAVDAIVAESLQKRYGEVEAVADVSFAVQRGRDLRPARPERRREVDDGADARDADEAGRRARARLRARRRAREQGGAALARLRRAELRHRPLPHRPREPRRAGARAAHGRSKARARAKELLELVGLADAGDRIVETLLRRDEAAPRHRARDRPPALRPLPRRADDRPRPGGPRHDVDRARAPRRASRR